ncbi:Rpn family recombination-promoting nuclease/putative transposase [Achromobacter sp. GG226]|uniref:Rpn family recombination-promoting nuclease/putative transposase n=1 Tax=Verticiella alkaliphila TaxID=2779529 RepID=UPI001C0C9BED|nr:Rpn family recombination-promoting nuclease/putative transposase [Verticiella sp. GG226]MBU4611131.1 Rpn family recombination-promoting nuclease/putative transposase [Verticiella sp. GG226]
MSLPHDSGYRGLFGHPVMVEHLLRGFVPEAWVGELDFTTLEPRGGHYVTDDLAERRTDLVWRVRLGGERWLYVYLLLEFQSRDDAWMALRMLAYVSLLYQDLVKTGEVGRAGELPPVFPLVVHHGSRPWRAAREMRGLFAAAPDALAAYQPSLRYFVLDEHRAGLPGTDDNLVAHLIALEKSPSPQATRRSIMQLHRYLKAPRHDSLRRAFTVYIQRVLLARLVPGETIPEVNDLQEMDAMLAERVVEWTEKWKQDGLQAGLEQGLREGRERGLVEGRERGLAEGREVGLQEGRQEGRQEGIDEGLRLALRTLLQARFGPLPDWAEPRLMAADTSTLDAWARAVLTAASLQAILGPAP